MRRKWSLVRLVNRPNLVEAGKNTRQKNCPKCTIRASRFTFIWFIYPHKQINWRSVVGFMKLRTIIKNPTFRTNVHEAEKHPHNKPISQYVNGLYRQACILTNGVLHINRGTLQMRIVVSRE
jgi:hypothetical protein